MTFPSREYAQYCELFSDSCLLIQSYIVDACRHVTHILEDLPTCKPAIDHLLELLPRLQPRFYSISSSSRVHQHRIHVTAVVIEYTTKTGRTNKGVATTWYLTSFAQFCIIKLSVRGSKNA